ncbi:hypothetical protein [Acetobacterium wieringae]|uniref:hypothetical protein n=1 Tax=Acetobacterium wieringae TaxID=52694 RepID=UPI0020334CCD|nr:hypothetical protein [Acetobacterium wieringae]URN84116.1 hypothetical protein CHL1_003291 [Acetobacterium wieringae]
MLEIIYVLSMAVAFTYKYDGILVSFWLKYYIALAWIGIWIFFVFRRDGLLKGASLFYIKQYCVPIFLIMLWTFIVWVINRPEVFDLTYISRSVSNSLCLLLAVLSAIAACNIFKAKAIELSLYAIFISTAVNIVRALQVYGVPIFAQFLKSAFIVTDFDVMRPTFRISQMLEVHDATLACGFFLIYYLFFCPDKTKKKWLYILGLVFCAYVGFKRVVFVGILVVFLLLFLLKKRVDKFEKIINIVGIMIGVLGFVYIIIIKIDLLHLIANYIGLDFSGRLTIYNALRKYYSLWPTFLGTGYGYINKLFEERMGLAAHSDMVRMYVELGFIPYLIWLYHYLIRVPKRILKRYGITVGRLIMAFNVYLFTTYFVGNAMSMFCIQYSFILIPVALSYRNETRENNRNGDMK